MVTRISILILPILFLLSSCNPEEVDVLFQKAVVNTNQRVNSMYFMNDTLGFACGGDRYTNGFIMKTIDGGLSWSVQDQVVEFTLFDIDFYNESIGQAVGYGGKIARTIDGGETWEVIQYHSYERLNAVQVMDSDITVIAGGDGYNDGFLLNSRENWWEAYREDRDATLLDCQIGPSGIGYACGHGILMQTTDFGENWTLKDIRGDFFSSISLVNEDIIYVCGLQGSIQKSYDGGETWDKVLRGNGAFGKRTHLESIDFINPEVGMAAGYNGLLLYTDNGGLEWKKIDLGTDTDLRSVLMLSASSAVVSGDEGSIWTIQF